MAIAAWTELQEDFARYLDGDLQATRKVFSALEKALRGFYAVRLPSEEEAEDLTQTALLKIHFARDSFNPRLSLKTWAFTVARHALIDHWRGSDDEETDSDEGLIEASAASENLAAKIQAGEDLKKALSHLKPIDRSIVYLYGIEGLSMAEVGESLGLTENAAKVRAHRAYAKLREILSAALLAALIRNL